MQINFRLKELRKEKGLTQTELGKIFKVSQVQISRWEKRAYDPSYENVIKMALFFNVTIDYLLGFVDERREYRCRAKK